MFIGGENMYNLVIKRKKPSRLNIEEYNTETITFAKKEVAKEYAGKLPRNVYRALMKYEVRA